MGRRVAIIGGGLTRHRAHLVEQTWRDLVVDATFDALTDCGLEPPDLQAGVVAFVGESAIETGNVGPLVADAIGMAPGGVTGISGACSGGGMALYHAAALIAAGYCDVALASGFEKGSDLYEYIETIVQSSETEYEYAFGFTHLDWLALMTKRYDEKYRPKHDALVRWIEDRHCFARQHPKAFFYGQPMPSREEFQRSILFLASARADGAAAVILASEEVARRLGRPYVWLDGIGYASTAVYLPHKFQHAALTTGFDIADCDMTRVACKRALAMSGLDSVRSADLLQISDGAPAVAFMELEALGLYETGTSWQGVIEGNHGRGGCWPANTHGGSIAFGHASGAAALVGVIESVMQIRGDAGARQLDRKLDTAVCQASGGSNSNNTVAVLRRAA